MYTPIGKRASLITAINTTYEGDPIERKIERALNTNEPIEAVSPDIFTERKDGVLPQYDIRTDRFEIAQSAADKVSASYIAARTNAKEQIKMNVETPLEGTE